MRSDQSGYTDAMLTRRTLLEGAASALALALASPVTGAFAQTPAAAVLNTIVNPEPRQLVLGVNNQAPTLLVSSKIYEGLLTYAPDLSPRPNLAESWEVSEDGRTYTFRLQSGVTFHDGKPMTAEDVVFSIAEFHNTVNPRSKAIFESIEKAEAVDELTAVFTLKKPFEPFLLMFDAGSAAIVPAHIYKGTDFAANPANEKPIGTGPFKFEEWVKGSHIRLAKAQNYWREGLPRLDGIIYRVMPDSQSRALSLESGDVSLAYGNDIEPFDIPRFRADDRFVVTDAGNELISPIVYLDINHRVEPLNNPKFRRAMQLAMDTSFIVENLWFGVGTPAKGPIASTTRFHDASVSVEGVDPDAARALLDEMGLKPDGNGVRARLRLLPLPYGEVWTRLAEYVKQALADVGIETVLEATDAATWVKRLGEWDYDITFNWPYQWGDPSLGVSRIYTSDNIKKVAFANTGGYSNPEVDRLFAEAAAAIEPDVRRDLFAQLQKLIIEDAAYIYLFELRFATLHDKRLEDVITSATGPNSSFAGTHFG